MNEITLLREAGPEAPDLSSAARAAARATLLDEITTSGTGRGRPHARLPRRQTALRLGAGITVAAAAWAAAVVIAAPDGPPGRPSGSVTLVAFEPPAFPLSLDPAPEGMTPVFDAETGDVRAIYRGADEGQGFMVTVSGDEPEFADEVGRTDVSVGGRDAEIVMTISHACDDTDCRLRGEIRLVQERRDDQWVTLVGYGRYDDPDRLVELAGRLVNRPQTVPLQVHVAPANWSVLAYKEDRILTLANDAYEQQTLTVFLPPPGTVVPPDQLRAQLMGPVGPLMEVAVNGRPAYLVRTDNGPMDKGWYLQAQFPDGTTFVVQAPVAFTQEQVVEFAAQVSHTP